MKTYAFRVIIEPDEKNTFHGFVPSLPGCHTWGESIENTRDNLREAIRCHIQGLRKDGERIPHEDDVMELIQTFSEIDLTNEPILA
jgi:antitoxin HicB